MSASHGRQLRHDHAPTPFTAKEIHAGSPPGRSVVTRTVGPGGGTTYSRTDFGHADLDTAIVHAGPSDPSGQWMQPPSEARVTWSELQSHASFPASTTTVSTDIIVTHLGRWECLRYDVAAPSAPATLWFALALPGMPIAYESAARRSDIVSDQLPATAHRLRYMTPHDASGYAEVQVAAWRATYAGIMSAEYLRDLDRDQVAARVRERLPDFPAAHKPTRALVATLAGRVVGIAAVGRASDAGNDFPSGQLWMINVHPDVWGTGVGTDLHSFALRVLLALGHREAYLWVARANARARRFYEREGWLATGVEQRENIGGAAVPEVMYRRRLD